MCFLWSYICLRVLLFWFNVINTLLVLTCGSYFNVEPTLENLLITTLNLLIHTLGSESCTFFEHSNLLVKKKLNSQEEQNTCMRIA